MIAAVAARALRVGLASGLLAACAARTAPVPASTARKITVVYVADLHGQLHPHPELFWGPDGDRFATAGGLARVAAAVARIEAEEGDVLFLDAGDTIQGSGVAALSQGAALVPPLRALPLDGALPGNWEVVYGTEVLRRRMAELDHPVFAANVRDDATGERLFPPWIVAEIHGVRVGVVGFTDPDVPRRQPPAYSRGLAYDGADVLPGVVAELRAAEDVDVVLLMSHVGLSKAVALAERVPGVDVHLSSDTHERTYAPVEAGGTWVVEPGAFGSFLGRLDLWVDDGRIVDKRWELIELDAAIWPEDPAVAALVDAARAPFAAELDEVVGHTADALVRYAVVETSLDAVLSDALREAGGTDVALSNGFRFGTPLLPGPIRVDDLWSFYPIVAPLKVGSVTGRQLRAFWEQELENVFAADPTARFGGWVPRPSGMTLRFVADAPKGQRIREILVGGAPLEDDRRYTITACEREGEPFDTVCRIPGAADVRLLDVSAHDVVRRYLAAHGPLRAPPPGRVVALDRPTGLRSQLDGAAR